MGCRRTSMDMRALGEAVRGLFGICVAAAAMEQLAGEGSMAKPFRALCALAATLCVLRLAEGLIR